MLLSYSLSQYVTDSNQCGEMVSLLLPFLNRNMNRSVEVETSILEATQHLVKRAPKPSVFLRYGIRDIFYGRILSFH